MINAYNWLNRRLQGELYGIAVLDLQPKDFLESKILSTSNWITIPKSKGYIADPFFWPGQPEKILCETYDHFSGIGRLEELTIKSNAIEKIKPFDVNVTTHLSYPYTWGENGRTFCLPEMAQSKHQSLYELKPNQKPILLCTIAENVELTDPTITKINDTYWLAYTDMKIGIHDNLCLLYANKIEGPWKPHNNNPVKIDLRSSRSAGTPFWVKGQLYRPAQNCVKHYGSAVVINAVRVCTPTHYVEEAIADIEPDPNGPFPDGIHTLSFGNNKCVIDGKKISYHPAVVFDRTRQLVERNVKKLWS